MEAYKTTCGKCGHIRFWTGFKTGLGKTDEQLAEMHRQETTCVKCGSTDARTELDMETEDGRRQSAAAGMVVSAIFGRCLPPTPPTTDDVLNHLKSVVHAKHHAHTCDVTEVLQWIEETRRYFKARGEKP